MGCSEPRPLGPADLPGALRLSAGAGWNQVAEDWGVFLRHGEALGIECDGALAASGAALPYGGGFGFVSMVLVAPEWRRRGLATRLVGLAIEALRGRGLVPVLDATPEGRPVYARLGFREVLQFDRWGGEAAGAPAASDGDPAAAVALDPQAFGADRGFLLRDFLARPGARLVTGADGFALARPGYRATQLGPVVAGGADAAIRLLERLLARLAGPVFLDLPARWEAVARWLSARGFTPRRGFTRMALGRDAPFGDPSRAFVLAGPEFG